MRYGRRIRNGNNATVEWCELASEEVIKTLWGNISLNADIYQQCVHVAMHRMNVKEPEDKCPPTVYPKLQREVREMAVALFEQCAVKAFVALQGALDERIHEQKTNGRV